MKQNKVDEEEETEFTIKMKPKKKKKKDYENGDEGVYEDAFS